VTHNCPSEIISSVSFGLSVETVADDAFIVHDEETPKANVTNEGVDEIVVYAKHEAGEGIDQDFGFWHPKLDGEPSFTYTYPINYAEGAAAAEDCNGDGDQGSESSNTDTVDNRVVTLVSPHNYTAGDEEDDASEIRDYNSTEGVFQLGVNFVKAGTVRLIKIEGQDPGRIFEYGSGCRRLSLTNGIDTVNTDWLGGAEGCSPTIDGLTPEVKVKMEPDLSQGTYIEYLNTYSYVN
jgi:hypothetical protein